MRRGQPRRISFKETQEGPGGGPSCVFRGAYTQWWQRAASRSASREAEGTGPVKPRQPAPAQGAKPGRAEAREDVSSEFGRRRGARPNADQQPVSGATRDRSGDRRRRRDRSAPVGGGPATSLSRGSESSC